MEMCLVIPLRFPLHKLMVHYSESKTRRPDVHHAQISVNPHKSTGSQLFTQYEDLAGSVFLDVWINFHKKKFLILQNIYLCILKVLEKAGWQSAYKRDNHDRKILLVWEISVVYTKKIRYLKFQHTQLPETTWWVYFFNFHLLGKWDFTSLPKTSLVLNKSQCCPPSPSRKTPLRKKAKEYIHREKFHRYDFGTVRTLMPFQEDKLTEN